MFTSLLSRTSRNDSPSECRRGDLQAESLALIASLTLEELAGVEASRKGKAKSDSPLSDEEFAFQLYAEEASSLLAYSRDAVFARSIDDALDTDGALLRDHVASEIRATRDRDVALALNEGRPPSPDSQPTASSRMEPLPLLMDTMSLNSGNDVGSSQASSSRSQISAPSTKPAQRNECIICGDPITGREVRAPCGHFYDTGCLTDLFRSATVDESLFPPRCCQQPFVFEAIRPFLNLRLALEFQTKSREFSTPNRVYCHHPTCSAFLGAVTAGPVALQCSKCYTRTCGSCKEPAHPSLPCDTALDQPILALAEQEGWKRCPGCHHLVELSVGCFHMTCRCRHQFCYLCAAQWKTCTCPQWEEQRLFAAAEQRVERQLPPRGVGAPAQGAFARLVQQEAERLRTNHDCAHTSWRIRHGAGRCESCHFNLDRYLLRCLGCQMLACVRCRRNRL